MERIYNWFVSKYSDNAIDIVNHGIDSGFGGLCYYSDLSKIYDEFEDELWDLLGEMADNYGYSSPLQMLANSDSQPDSDSSFRGLVVWHVVEYLADRYVGDLERITDELDWDYLDDSEKEQILADHDVTADDLDVVPPALVLAMA